MLIEVYNSVGGAAFFERLLREWTGHGAEVRSFQAVSAQDYRESRGALERLAVRWKMYGGHAWNCWRAGRKMHPLPSLRVVTTNPFFAPALVARAARGRGGATINLVYDLYPEALTQTGELAADSWLARRCAKITRQALAECDVTVFLGERLRKSAEAAHGCARRALVIPVGADGRPFDRCRPRMLLSGEKPAILYAGLMGQMHDYETLLALWGRLKQPEVSWVFHASGAGYLRLRRAAGNPPGVAWNDPLSDAAWQQTMLLAPVALVTIAPGAERVVMPSKTYSAMVAGQAILAVCPRDSDLADLVLRHECGWVVPPGGADRLAAVLDEIAQDSAGLWTKRKRSFAAGHEYYDMRAIAATWMSLFAELSGENSTPRRPAVSVTAA